MFWGVSYFSGRLLAKQTDLRPLIPLLPSSALRIMGSLRTSSCQERSPGHHPDICSSVKPPHTTLCCILTFIPSHSCPCPCLKTSPDTVSYSKVCRKGSMYELSVCIHWYLTCLFGAVPTKEPASLFQWPAAWYSLCLWAPSVEWSGSVWRGAVYCSLRHWEQKQDWEACVGPFFTALPNSALHYTHTTQTNTQTPSTWKPQWSEPKTVEKVGKQTS